MREFRCKVNINIDVDPLNLDGAATPEEAARQAYDILRDPDSCGATCS